MKVKKFIRMLLLLNYQLYSGFFFFFLKKSLKLFVTIIFLLLFGVENVLKQYQQPLDLFRALTSATLNLFHYFRGNYSLGRTTPVRMRIFSF